MLKESMIKYCIVGHSERREKYNEKNETINQKVEILINNKIIPILCVGETLQNRENNQSNMVVGQCSTGCEFCNT